MKVRQLIAELLACEPEALVHIEQTNDAGSEELTAVVAYPHGSVDVHCSVVVLQGDLFK